MAASPPTFGPSFTGQVVVGWGTASHTTGFAPDGTPLLDVALPGGMYSYRGLWLGWRSTPHGRPALRARREHKRGTKLIYASWNGATEVTDWRVDAGHSAAS